MWFTVQPRDINGLIGSPVILHCHVEGYLSTDDGMLYQWLQSAKKDGPFTTPRGCLFPFNSEVLFIQSLSDQHVGYYKCQVTINRCNIPVTSNIVHVGATLPDTSGKNQTIKLLMVSML